LGIAPRTLRYWRQQSREDRLRPRPRGRTVVRSDRQIRNRVVRLLCEAGPQTGLPTLRGEFPTLPRSELKDLQCRFRHVWRYKKRQLIHRLHWRRAGSVWAADHVQPEQPTDGKYPYALAVRDLASHCQLAWEPVPDVGAETTTAVVRRLIEQLGSPLVFKSDNGSAFIAQEMRALLEKSGILHLRNPPATPQYNGSCEAAGGSQQKATEHQALLAGRPGRWTSQDLRRARTLRNRLGRPFGHRGPTPDEAWEQRPDITNDQRCGLQATVKAYRDEERQRRGVDDEAKLDGAVHASIDRVAIRRALMQHGYLHITRRLITPPLNIRGAAKIS
jgi:transposase InsO family protein